MIAIKFGIVDWVAFGDQHIAEVAVCVKLIGNLHQAHTHMERGHMLASRWVTSGSIWCNR